MSGSSHPSSDQPEPVEEEPGSLLASFDETANRSRELMDTEDLAGLTDLEAQAKLRELQVVLHWLDRASECTAPPGSVRAEAPLSGDNRPADLPERIGHFKIMRELGRGGCGIVFLAIDEALGRQVALKVPRPEALVSRELRRRFLGEAKAAALVDHPNIVPVYEVCTDDPICYIASAYIEGPSLVAWLQQQERPVDPAIAAEWIGNLADATQHAHSRGIFHRDIKPGNVLLELQQRDASNPSLDKSAESEFIPKLTDFGLAKLQNGRADLTRTGALVGTPSYMAPEQAEGRLEKIGPATDVYALGAILYELLTGKPPYHGESEPDTLRQVVSQEPAPPRRFRSEIPPDLEAICLKCLEKDPEARYPSARALSDDIDRFLQGRPTKARPMRWWQRTLRWIHRKPAAAALVAVSIFAMMTIGIGGWWSSVRYKHALEISQRRLYVSDVRLAYQAWQSRDTPQMIHLLSRHVPSAGEKDFRSFPWHYLWRLCHGELQVLEGHHEDVYAVDFSPDDTVLASASCDGSVRLWDVSTGKQIGKPIRHPDEVNHIRFSPDGTILASTCDDGYIRLWSYPGRQLLRSFAPHSGATFVIDFAPAGDVFATCGNDPTVKIWDTETGKLVHTLDGHTDSIQNVCFSRNGTLLATGSNDSTIRLWSWPGGKELAILDVQMNCRVGAVAFSPDDSILATAGARAPEIHIWNVADRRLLDTLDATEVRVRNLTWDPSGHQLVATGDGETRIWDFDGGAAVRTRRGPVGHVWMSKFSSNARLLATAGRDGMVRLWNSTSDLEYHLLPTHGPNYGYCFTPDGKMVAVANTDGTVNLVNVSTGDAVKTFRSEVSEPVTNSAISPDGSHLAIVTNEKAITICAMPSGKVEKTIEGGEKNVYTLAFSRDSKQLATGGKDGQVILWSLSDQSQMIRLPRFDSPILDLGYSPDGQLLAVASGASVTLVDINEWNQVATLPHLRLVRCVLFTPNGTMLFTAGDDKKAMLWDLSTHQPSVSFVGHQDRIVSISLSPQQKTLATIAGDGTLRLWDVPTGQELIAFSNMQSNRPIVAFSPDGEVLATNAWDSADYEGIILLDASPTIPN